MLSGSYLIRFRSDPLCFSASLLRDCTLSDHHNCGVSELTGSQPLARQQHLSRSVIVALRLVNQPSSLLIFSLILSRCQCFCCLFAASLQIHPTDFKNDPILPKFFKMLSTNVDLNGRPFVSSVEAISFPFFALQWHAERTQFEWSINDDLDHGALSIAVHSYVAQRWLFHVRKNQHRFPSVKQEQQALIYQYAPYYNGNSTSSLYPSQQIYSFNFQF